ncbi:MAG: 3'-5' exonuclease [Opitutales bacterium]
MNFTAIDFETAQGYRWSICQVGLVRVEDGEVVAEYEQLVQPPTNYYWHKFTRIHGICAAMTLGAPTFAVVWPEISGWIAGQTVVAHNMRFDGSCLRQTLAHYGIEEPSYSPACTYGLFRKALDNLSEEFGICLIHHNALSDARACAQLFLASKSHVIKTG